MKKIFTILFFVLLGLNNITAATFVSKTSGGWSAGLTTWTLTSGTDADKIPDSDDNVSILAGHAISLTTLQNDFKTLTIAATATLNTNSQALNAYGNLTNNGKISGNFYYFRVFASCTLTSSTPITNSGVWWVYANLNIPSGTVISKANAINLRNSAIVSNLGSVTINSSSLVFSGTPSWVNGTNSFLSLGAPCSGTVSLNASASGNTVVCNTGCTSVPSATYYDLTLTSTSSATKTATGNITVINTFSTTSGTNNVFSMGNFNLTILGNWTNQANKTILNQGTTTFSTSTSQTISRTSGNEVFNNLVIGGTGTTLLARPITANGNVSINSGTLDVSASNFSVNVLGNLVNNSSITTRQGTFRFAGTIAQTISGSTNTNFYNVTSSNAAGVLVTSSQTVSNLLTVSAGAFGTSGAGVLTIPATGATTYGKISTVGATGSLTGTGWDIKSYIDGPAPKGWQWLSSPINGNTLADWDNDPRFYMSGVNGNDGNAAGFKSVRTYNEISGNYVDITTTATALTAGKGFMVWMADNNTTGLTSPLIYNSAGTPNFANVSFPITAGGAGSGYNLVGNPYACPITYATVVAASGNLFSSFIILLEDNTYSTDPNGGVIAPNQGFMCVASSSGNILFTEACKNIVTSPNILRTAQKEDEVTFTVYNNINGIGGRTNIQFLADESDNYVNGKDLTFLTSPSEEADHIFTKSNDNKALLKNVLSNDGNDKLIPLTVTSGVYGIHHISAKGLTNLKSYKFVWLENIETGEKFDLLKGKDYQFDAKEIAKNYEFMVHFSNKEEVSKQQVAITSNVLNENTSVYNTQSNVVVKFDMPESTPVKISVYSLTGQQVIEPMNLNVTNDRIALPLQKENSLYLLIIQSKDQQITRKIIY